MGRSRTERAKVQWARETSVDGREREGWRASGAVRWTDRRSVGAMESRPRCSTRDLENNVCVWATSVRRVCAAAGPRCRPGPGRRSSLPDPAPDAWVGLDFWWWWGGGGRGAALLMVGAEPRVRVGAWVFARGPGVVSADMRGPGKRNGGHQEAVIRGAAASPRGGACRVPRVPKVAAFLVSLLLYILGESIPFIRLISG
ncbi:hypothetical protein D1007_18502 [Hordeum vulgare]|nr:hypothetical protein D1007_18502 [Hordeum vulgare]